MCPLNKMSLLYEVALWDSGFPFRWDDSLTLYELRTDTLIPYNTQVVV